MLELIPVIDLKENIAVSGKSGNRETYTPLKTIYSANANPLEIAQNLKLNGANRIYIADLDLIEKQGHNLDTIKNVNMILHVILDAGVKNFQTYKFYLDFAYKIIVATETLENLEELDTIFKNFPKERIILSVDIKDNKLYSKNLKLNIDEFKEILRKYNPGEIILLDISSVGTNKGFNKELLNSFIEFKDKIILGGGIKPEDLKEIEDSGIKKVLIGTNLHNGNVKLH